jgi:chemotaxis signal transduction protein
VPIEVPDTRAFAEPPPRRRRAKPELPVEPAPATAPVEVAESAFRKPVRRRRAVDAALVVEVADDLAAEALFGSEEHVAAASGFSRPVRRRPRAEPSPVPEAVVAAASAEPVATRPAVAQPPGTGPAVAAEPVAAEPVAAEPVAAEPVAAEPVAAEPVAAEPVGSEPVVAEPAAVSEPVAPVAEERRGVEGAAEAVVALTETVVVRLAGTRYAVDMNAVAEVGRPPHVTRVPGVPSWIAGVANWRGRVLPVLDLRILLGAPTPELGVGGRILVLTREGVTLAFLAERVEGVVSLEMDGLEPVLATLSRTTASVLAGQLTHPDGPIAVLDLDTVFGLRSQLPRVRRAG